MRLTVTVVSPRQGRQSSVVLDAEPQTPVADVAARIAGFMQYDRTRWTAPPLSPVTYADPVGVPLYIDGQRVPARLPLARSPLRDGCVISLGGPQGCVPPEPAPGDGVLARSADGAGLDFNRPPRLLPPRQAAAFTLPVPPPAAERRPLPVLMSVLPLVMGVAMAYFLHQVYLLAMAGLSPVLLVGSALSERRQGRKATAARMAEYTERADRVNRDAAAAVAAELAVLRGQCPGPAEVLATATGPRRRLWERRRTDPDYLLLSVGTGDLPASVRLTDPAADEHRRTAALPLRDAPVTIPLRERGVIGIAGPDGDARAAGRWLVAQAAVLHSPVDLRIYVLTDNAGKECWEWVRWLPHCRPAAAGQDGRGCAAQVGNDAESVAARIAELLAVIAARRQAQRDSGRLAAGEPAGPGCDVMVVLDGSRKLRALPGVIQLLREGPEAGVYAVCLDTDERLLPAECQAVAACAPDGLRVQQMLAQTVAGGRAQYADPGWCTRLARSLAPVRDVSPGEDDGGLPDSARLLDLLGLEPPGPARISAGRPWPPPSRPGGAAAAGPRRRSSVPRTTGRSRSTSAGTDRTGSSPGPPGRGNPNCCRRSSPRWPSRTGPTS